MDTFLNRKCVQIHNLNSRGGGGGKQEKKKLKLIKEKNRAQLHRNFKNGESKQMFKSNSILSNFWKDSNSLQTIPQKNMMFIYFVNGVEIRKR